MPSTEPITVVFAGDDGVAIPMAAAIASAIMSKTCGRRLDFHVFDCGVARNVRDGIAGMVSQAGESLTWHDVSGDRNAVLVDLYTRSSRPYPPANYARLLVGDLLPPQARRAIYLDADVIVLADLEPLWLKAVASDAAALVVRDLPHDAGHLARLRRSLAPDELARYPVAEDGVYFQAGVMALNVEAFRAGVASEILAVLRRHPEFQFPDQDALNVVLHANRELIDPRWNQMTAIYWYEGWRDSPFECEVFEALRAEPFVAHFSGRPKPWEEGCAHPLRDRWSAAIARTPWADSWRPTRAGRILGKLRRGARTAAKRLRRALGSA